MEHVFDFNCLRYERAYYWAQDIKTIIKNFSFICGTIRRILKQKEDPRNKNEVSYSADCFIIFFWFRDTVVAKPITKANLPRIQRAVMEFLPFGNGCDRMENRDIRISETNQRHRNFVLKLKIS